MRKFAGQIVFVAVCGVIASSVIIARALAQGAADTFDPSAQLVGEVCSHQALVSWVVGILLAHAGFSGVSAALKKFGMTGPDAPWWVTAIRFAAVDVKPPPAVLQAEVAAIAAQPLKQ